jgi:hypothetical protein
MRFMPVTGVEMDFVKEFLSMEIYCNYRKVREIEQRQKKIINTKAFQGMVVQQSLAIRISG